MNQSQQIIESLGEAGKFPNKKSVFDTLEAALGKDIKSKSFYDPKTGIVTFDGSVSNLDRLVTSFRSDGFNLVRLPKDQQQAGSIKMQFQKR